MDVSSPVGTAVVSSTITSESPPPRQRILVLGAPAGARASLAAARTAGFHVIAADANPAAGGFMEADEAVVCPVQASDVVIEVARRVRAHGIVATTDFAVVAAATAARALALPGIDPDAAQNAISKLRMRTRWAQERLPQPRVTVVHDRTALDAAATQTGFPVICKPANALGGGSRGISIAGDRDALSGAWEAAHAVAPDGVVLIEQCVAAVSEHSVEVLFHEGTAHVLAIGDKIKTPAPYRVDLAVCYPTALDARTRSEVAGLAEASARALGIHHGMAHVEIGVTAEGAQLFELGARCGGGATAAPVVPLATGIDEFVEACRVACGSLPRRTRPVHQHGVCYRFIAPHAGRRIETSQLEAIRQMRGVISLDVWGSDPASGDATVRTGGDRIGALVTTAPTREEAIAIADEAIACLSGANGDSPPAVRETYSRTDIVLATGEPNFAS